MWQGDGESDVVPKDWRSAMIVPQYKGKDRGLNAAILEVPGYWVLLEKYMQGS